MTERASYILIRPLDTHDGFLAYAVGMEGCVVEGRTEEESLANLKAAIEQRAQSEFARQPAPTPAMAASA